jgi:hypothetical protein
MTRRPQDERRRQFCKRGLYIACAILYKAIAYILLVKHSSVKHYRGDAPPYIPPLLIADQQ